MIISVSAQKMISIDISSSFTPCQATVNFGNPKNYCHVPILLSFPFTWVSSKMYRSDHSSSSKRIIDNHTEIINNASFTGEVNEDIMFLKENIILHDFPFYCIRNFSNYNTTSGGIGLAYIFPNESYSVIHFLFNKGLISSLQFSIVKIIDAKGLLYLGGIPQDKLNMKKHGFCNVIGKNTNWDCRLNKVSFLNWTYINEDYSFFDSSIHLLEAPISFITYLKETYFHLGFNTNVCSHLSYKKRKRISCQKGYVVSLSKISFFIGDYAYSLGFKNLFFCYRDYCDFNIIESNSNNWHLSSLFLENYSLLFDYTDKKIHFYSEDNIEYVGHDFLFLHQNITYYIALIIILIVGIIILKVTQVYYLSKLT